MTGALSFARLTLRTSFLSILGWALGLNLLLWSAASSILDMYPDDMHRKAYAAKVTASAATRTFQGRGYDLTRLGGILVQEMGIITLTLFPIVAAHLAIRFTRSQEDRGVLDVATAGMVGRLAPVIGGYLAAVAALVLTTGSVAATMLALGYDAAGTVRYALGLLGFMILAASLGLLCAQFFRNGKEAHFAAIAGLLGCYLFRGYVDVDARDLNWSNPASWLAEVRPYADHGPWWPYACFLLASAGLVTAALYVASRRDLGGGMFDARRGPARGGAWLRGPIALLTKLTLGSTLAFLGAASAMAFVFGVFAKEMAKEGGLEDRLVLLMQINSIFALCAAVVAASVMGSEEASGRAGRVLAEPVGRVRWVASVALVAVLSSLVTLLVAGLASGLGLGIGLEDWGRLPAGIGDTMAYAPAVIAVAALTVLLGSVHPRATLLSWLVVVWAAVVAVRADMLQLSRAARRVSPLEWMGKVPVEAWEQRNALVMVTGALVAIGLACLLLRRRSLVAG